MKRKPELVLPAGNYQKLKYAFLYGADACYFGLPDFSIRNRSTNFNLGTLKKAIEYSHSLNKKAYITINTYPHNQEFKKLKIYLQRLRKIKPDAIIISDCGVLNLVKKYLPNIDIHLSTQANTVNYEAVKFWRKIGIKRIILARELSFKEIKEIRKKCPQVELEVFIHGAMCVAYSGRCLLSLYMTERNANRGECTQPCRWQYKPYYLEEKLRPFEFWPIEEDKDGSYILNSKDLCLIDYLPQLVKIGIDAFKIEGRAKSIYYLSIVTKTYRRALDLINSSGFKIKNYQKELSKLRQELLTIHHRGYTSGFITGKLKDLQEYNTSRPYSDWQFCGEVKRFNKKTKELIILVHNHILPNTEIEFITPDNNFKFKIKEIINLENKKLEAAHAGNIIKIKFSQEIPSQTIIRQKLNKYF